MKSLLKIGLAAVALGVLAQAPASAQGQASAKEKPPVTLKVMTFNLRFASPTPPNSWPQRRPVTSELLRRYAPDIIGTQEGVYSQLKDIAKDRPEYAWFGLGRDGGSRGESMAIFYLRDRFEPLEYDYFWLSDTPDVIGSSTWGNTNRRMVTWVKFRDLQSNRDFYFWNTHFDHAIQEAREKAAALVAQRVKEKRIDASLPLILTGDFNANSRANKTYDILTGTGEAEGGFTDAWFSAKQRLGQNYASFHNYAAPTPDGPHIDWILTRGPVAAEDAQVVSYNQDGQYPSDHFPIMATLTLGTNTPGG